MAEKDLNDDPTSGGSKTAEGPKKNYRRDKPWDTDDIDKWKVLQIEDTDVIEPFLDCSSFATLFPKYREVYLRESWPEVTKGLATIGISCELNLIEGSMTVKTTRKTRDPYAIFKARDLIKLLARSVPLQQALKIFEEGMFCDIIKIGKIISNEEKFVKRRQRLIGPNGNTLKALELLTRCYILVQGNTVACMGSFKGLKIIRRIVLDCIKNIHPIYHIKELMIKRELEKDPKLMKESWDRFLPHFKNRSIKRKKIPKKKSKSVFPPPQPPRKIDLQIESGEYFLDESEKKKATEDKRKKKMSETLIKKREEREKLFISPKENKTTNVVDQNSTQANPSKQKSISELKDNLKSNKTRHKSKNSIRLPLVKNKNETQTFKKDEKHNELFIALEEGKKSNNRKRVITEEKEYPSRKLLKGH